jgi:hypothetical protein
MALFAGFGVAIGLTAVFMQPPPTTEIALPEGARVFGNGEWWRTESCIASDGRVPTGCQ